MQAPWVTISQYERVGSGGSAAGSDRGGGALRRALMAWKLEVGLANGVQLRLWQRSGTRAAIIRGKEGNV
jgi:hypothetical protein